jgi:hypothetical protein
MARRLSLRRALTSLKKKPTETLSMFFARATKIRDELKGADQSITEDEVVSSVLAGLPQHYDVSIAIMEFSDKALTMDDCLAKLLQVEHKLGREEAEPSAFYTRVHGFKPGGGGGGGAGAGAGAGAHRGSGPISSSDARVCHYCGVSGHIMPNCYQRRADLKKSAEYHQPGTVSFAAAY